MRIEQLDISIEDGWITFEQDDNGMGERSVSFPVDQLGLVLSMITRVMEEAKK